MANAKGNLGLRNVRSRRGGSVCVISRSATWCLLGPSGILLRSKMIQLGRATLKNRLLPSSSTSTKVERSSEIASIQIPH